MNAHRTDNWQDANRAYLEAALARLAARLRAHREPGAETAAAERALADAEAALPAPGALETLRRAFALSDFERDLLLLCAGVQLDATFAERCAAALGQSRRLSGITFGLALSALPGAHWSALSPAGPLRYWRLLVLENGEGPTTAPLRADERIVHYLAGVDGLDERLQALLVPVAAPDELPGSHRALARRVARLWAQTPEGQAWAPVQLCGSAAPGRREIAAAAAADLELGLYALEAVDLPTPAAEREALARLWNREAVLSDAALLLDCEELEGAERTRALLAFLERLQGAALVAVAEPLRSRSRPLVRLDVPHPSAAEQQQLWQGALGPAAEELNGRLEALASQFRLGVPEIWNASAEARAEVAEGRAETLDGALWDACRAQARPRLENLAQRIDARVAWDDLVLPEAQRRLLREVAAHVRHRTQVYEGWGFARKSARGLGISALFAGASGTGKTLAAEVLAGELRLDLYKIDLSRVVSKYIGETEKNLRAIFDAAEAGGAILLFDEADALFGKRSEVKDSHDRYANIEVSYLLQRMESYGGLAILTTNMKQALDAAFLRRIRFIVQFPFPDAAQREQIWRRIFPPETPTDGLDFARLAQLNVSGGTIRNIALGAAFLAAEAGEPVRMPHLLRAAESEYGKLERSLTPAEKGGWS